jgi:hypothetical protein
MFKGLDTTDAIDSKTASALKDAGYSFLIKYTANSSTFPKKRLSHEERSILVAHGINSGFVFEKSDQYDYFSASQGATDSKQVIDYFSLLGVPQGQTCFAAVDFDATISQIHGQILAYFKAFHDGLKADGYLTGIYGSGTVCNALKLEGLAHWTWKAQSPGWSGFTYDSWDISQGLGHVLNLSSDPDMAKTLALFW